MSKPNFNLCSEKPKGSEKPKADYFDFDRCDVYIPEIEQQHWKVGDGLTGTKNNPDKPFIISQIAVVLVNELKNIFEIRYYDEDGEERGAQKVKLVE